MDILSMGKAMKAKKAMKEFKDRLGEGVQDIHPNVKTRLEELEKKDPGTILNKRVSALEANTAVNLNKHNLKVKAITQHDKFKMSELVYDDLADATGIDAGKSKGHAHDPQGKKFQVAAGQSKAEVITVAEPVNANQFAISFAGNGANYDKVSVPLTGGTYNNTEIVNGKLQLTVVDSVSYNKTGSYESPVIDLGDNFKELYKVEEVFDAPAGTGKQVLVSSSADGLSFSEYLPLNSDGTIATPSGRYVKIRVELTAGGSTKETLVHDFTAEERSAFQDNEHVVFDGAAKMKTDYQLPMEADASYAEAGTLLKTTLNKSVFRTFEKVEVK